ncbi:cation-translocating P-type ATPase [Sulfoacidibacillus ferrooxidans]|uniref:Calcium-transporting ATPase n=1 Tax=Sulfoacidibacillus ferrooxidans TaxID=2005001 RepID=A0A9X2AE68_9BACL|nr:HAD-IC family P-type ATPase [Sulfoacidibacillus ferrooxidans]MCI0182831.1 Calcium-transporting ATPase [Sulfoacidibacillus ferrooxidans]
MSVHMECELVRQIPGRMRFAVPYMRGNKVLAKMIYQHLTRYLPQAKIRADDATGRILISFEEQVDEIIFPYDVNRQIHVVSASYFAHMRQVQMDGVTPLPIVIPKEEPCDQWRNDDEQRLPPPLEQCSCTDTSRGLTVQQVEQRIATYGYNVLPTPRKPSVWRVMWSQISDWMSLTLVGVAGVSLLTGRFFDALTISLVLAVNGTVGALQERRVSKETEALRQLTSYAATVIRDGIAQVIPASEVVVGEIVLLEAGDRVPADGILIEAYGLWMDESMLTGESQPVEKILQENRDVKLDTGVANGCAIGSSEAMFMGTGVTRGRGKMMVTAIGANTQMGVLASSLSITDVTQTPLQQRVHALGRLLVFFILGTVALVVLVGIWRGLPLSHMLLTGMALAASAIPEGLPLLITIGLTAGVRRMGKSSALVRKLSSVETLGRVTVICSDKTGTLTKNEMTVRHMWTAKMRFHVTGNGYDPRGHITTTFHDHDEQSPAHFVEPLARLCVLCNNAELLYNNKRYGMSAESPQSMHADQFAVRGDPTDGALLVMALKAGIDVRDMAGVERIHEWPFESEKKRMSVICKDEQGVELIAKGALEEILARSTFLLGETGIEPLSLASRTKMIDEAQEYAKKAMRVVAVAYRPLVDEEKQWLTEPQMNDDMRDQLERDLIFVGIVGMIDPPRSHVQESVSLCRDAGIRVLMITGDHPDTACAVARDIGLVVDDDNNTAVLTGEEMERMTSEQLADAVQRVSIFARMAPQHKLIIVDALKSRGQVVAMTGDGVNDAPAVRQADVGIAMGKNSTEVTREASEMTVTDESFSTIVSGVREGREVLGNIRRALGYLLSGNLGEVIYAALAVFLGMPLPFVPVQILLVNLLTDAAPTIGLVTRSSKTRRVSQSLKPQRDLLDVRYLRQIITHAVAISLPTLLVFALGLNMSQRVAMAQTMAMVTLSLAELMHIESWHRDDERVTSPIPTDKILRATFLGSFILVIGSIYSRPLQRIFQTTPLPMPYLLMAIGGSFVAYLLQTFERVRGNYYVSGCRKSLETSPSIGS